MKLVIGHFYFALSTLVVLLYRHFVTVSLDKLLLCLVVVSDACGWEPFLSICVCVCIHIFVGWLSLLSTPLISEFRGGRADGGEAAGGVAALVY